MAAVSYGDWGKIYSYSLAQTDMLQNTTQSETQSYTYPASNNLQGSQTFFAPQTRTITDANQYSVTESLTFGINGSLRKREVQTQPQTSYTEYYLFNSAANLKAYSNNGLDFAYYGYNAANTRTYKLSMLNQNQWVNGQPQLLNLQLQSAMFYPNAYLNFNHNGEYTKHYYNGTERIYSRLGNTTLGMAATANARLAARSTQLEDYFRNDIRILVYAGDIPMDMPLEPVSVISLQQTGTSNDVFYYHLNHLGSTAFITDQNKNIPQGFLYAPFGEITTEYAPMWQNGTLPKYSFNAKEFDEEIGMYYYEARYYKPPVFTSRDPMMNQKTWLSPYHYCSNNPVGRVDPTGMMDDWVEKADGIIYWDENATSQATTKSGEKYLGKNVIVATHNRDENGNEPINSATFDLYLESNKEGKSATINGNTVPSDVTKYGTLAEGLYRAKFGHRSAEKYKDELAVRIYNLNGTDGLPTLNGNPNKKNSDLLTGVLFHTGNPYQKSLLDSKGRPVWSHGCLTSGCGPGSIDLHNAFMQVVGKDFDGTFYLRAKPQTNQRKYDIQIPFFILPIDNTYVAPKISSL